MPVSPIFLHFTPLFSFPELQQSTITMELLGPVLRIFPYHHVPLEILIVKNLMIPYACRRAHHTKFSFFFDVTAPKNWQAAAGKEGSEQYE